MKANSCLLLTLIFLNISAVLCCHAELVLHWPLEEGSGITTAEISGNGHDGVFTNPDANNAWTITALAPVPSGTTAAVNMRKVAASDNYKGVTGKVERSVSAWIKTTELNGNICTWGRDTPSEKFVFRTQSQNGTQGAIRCEVNGGFIVGTQPVVDNNWHHVLAVVPPLEAPDVINIRLYVDGELQGVSASTSKALNTGDLNVFFAGGDNFGQVDEIRIYNHALNPVEINALAGVHDPYANAVTTDAPEAWWRMGESTGTRVANEGTVMAYVDGKANNFPPSDTYVPGLIVCSQNRALRFNGSDSWVGFPNHDVLNTAANYAAKTMESWLMLSAFSTNDPYRVIYEQGGLTSGFNQCVELVNSNYFLRSGAWSKQGGNRFPKLYPVVPIETGVVYHAVSVYDGAKTCLIKYLNGACVAAMSNVNITNVLAHADQVAVGMKNGATLFSPSTSAGGTNSFNGVIDEVATYNKVLSFERIQEHYVIGSGNNLGLRKGVTRGVMLNYDADNDNGAVGYIKDSIGTLDVNAGKNLFDFALNGNVTHVTLSDHLLAGVTNAWRFDGSSSATTESFRSITGYAYMNSAAVELLFKPADLSGDEVLFESGGEKQGISLALNGSLLRLHVRDSITVSADALFDLNQLPASQRRGFIHATGV